MLKRFSLVIVATVLVWNAPVKGDILIWRMSGGTPQREGLFTSMPAPPLVKLWETQTGLRLPGSVLTDGQNLFIAGNSEKNGKFACLEWGNGKILWQSDFAGRCLTTPVISNGKISTASTDGRIYGMGIDGKSASSIKTSFATCTAADPLDTGDLLVYCLEDYGAGVFAVDPNTSEKAWEIIRSSSNYVKYNICAGDGLIFIPYNDDLLVAIKDSEYKIETVWEQEISDGIAGSPMLTSGMLIVPTKKGILALDASNGKETWKISLEDNYHPETTPATDGRIVFVNTSNRIYAIDSSLGQLVWSQKFDRVLQSLSSPSVGSGMVCTTDGRFCFIFETDSGLQLAKFIIDDSTIEQGVIGQPLILWDRIVFATTSGKLICWGLQTDNPTPPTPPEPEPPKETPQISTLRIDAPEKGYIGEIIEIAIDLNDAKNWTNGEFTFVFDGNRLEFVGTKPGDLLISQNVPLEVRAEPNEFGARIFAGITKAGGITGKGTLAYVALKPKSAGVHNVTIIDAKMTDESRNTHAPNIEPDSFTVEEKTEPPPPPFPPTPPEPVAEFDLTPANIDLGIIAAPRTVTLRLMQRNGSKTRFVVRASGEYGLYTPGTGEIEANSTQEIRVTINIADLNAGTHELVLSVNVLDKTLKTSIKFIIPEKSAEIPSCIDIVPNKLDFGYIPRGREVSINFVIAFDSSDEISGFIEIDKPWLQVSPIVFKTRQKRIEGVATISASELPGGETFTGHMTIRTKGTVCRDVVVEAKVKTQPAILLEMDIGVSKAKIASMSVPLDSPPFIRNNRTLVPIRFVSEAFGCKVQWEASSKKITISRFTDSITLWVGRKEALVNGLEVKLDVAPSLESSTTFVPIRFISEAFGAFVEWFSETRHIRITYSPPEDFNP